MKKGLSALLVLSLAACGSATANLKERRAEDVELTGQYEILRCNGTQEMELANGLKGTASVSVMGYGDKGEEITSLRYSATFPLADEEAAALMETTNEAVVEDLKKTYSDAVYAAGSGNAIFIYSSVETKTTTEVMADLETNGFACENFAE